MIQLITQKSKRANAGKADGEKTNQDFNNQQPNPSDPNELKGHPAIPYPKIRKKIKNKL